jgi:hypothetical protein
MDNIDFHNKNYPNRADWRYLLPLLVFAGAIRIILSLKYPNAITFDELLQYKEQAYRIVTGHGVTPWEYRVGARSWFLPSLLVPVVYLTRLFSTEPAALYIAVTVFSSLMSLLIIPAGYLIAKDISGKQAARITAWILAVWCDFVFFSGHFMADTLVAIPLIWAIAISRNSHASFAAAARFGALLGLSAMLRMQLAPVLAVIALLSLDFRDYRKQLLGIIAGSLPVLIIFGAIDWITWGWPFYSYWMNLYANSGGVANYFGKNSFWYYLQEFRMNWSVMTPVLIVTAIAGSIRAPRLAVYCFIIVLGFSVIEHKEYRFIYPALPILLTLCGIGSAQILKLVSRAWPRAWQNGRLAAAPVLALALFWAAGSAWAMTRYGMSRYIERHSNLLIAVDSINADPRTCGVALIDNTWGVGQSGLRGDIKIFHSIDANANPAALPYNRIVTTRPELIHDFILPSEFRYLAKFEMSGTPRTVFVLGRDAPCSAGDENLMDGTWIDPELDKLLRQLNITFRM